jgi:tripartite-type tricarboxylate transporter receptor subunit TctC
LPEIPPERAAILRKAFLAMTKDEGFRAEAKTIGLDPDPLPGDELQRMVADTLNASGEALQRLRDVTHPER